MNYYISEAVVEKHLANLDLFRMFIEFFDVKDCIAISNLYYFKYIIDSTNIIINIMEPSTQSTAAAAAKGGYRSSSKSSQKDLSSTMQSTIVDDNFFEAKRFKPTDTTLLKAPKPESAPNKFLARLFASP